MAFVTPFCKRRAFNAIPKTLSVSRLSPIISRLLDWPDVRAVRQAGYMPNSNVRSSLLGDCSPLAYFLRYAQAYKSLSVKPESLWLDHHGVQTQS